MVFPDLIDTITILKPITGQSKALVKHLENLIVHTYQHGDQGVLRYELFRLLHEDEQLHIRITYQDQFAMDNHHKDKTYKNTMNLIEDRQLAIVKLKETRYWPCQNFTRCARVGSDLLDCIKCGKKRELWGPSCVGDKRMNESGKGNSPLFPNNL